MAPLGVMYRPVAVAAAVPAEESRLRVADGAAVLFPVGKACHWKVGLTAALVLELYPCATKVSGNEFTPAVDVAAPEGLSDKLPRMCALPYTSSVAAGALVPTPTPVEVWNRWELSMVDAPENNA